MKTPTPAIRADTIRILIVDGQASVREAIRMRLAVESDMAVIGEAPDGKTALAMAMAVCPDVVLMDVEIPDTDGLVSTSEFRRLCPETSIIMLTIYDDVLTQARARDAGAAAFVSKSMPPDVLLAVIRQVGQMRLPPGNGGRAIRER